LVGNDIVDLQCFDAPFYQHIGYLERVCTPAEADTVRRSKDASRALASVWAAKEAAYKLISRSSSLRHFVPRDFATDIAELSPGSVYDQLQVSCNGKRAKVTTFATEQWLHAVAVFADSCHLHWKVQEIHKPPFGIITPADESDIARQLARDLLSESGLKNASLDFVEGIPTLREGGTGSVGKAMSLSHHGRFVAAALGWASAEFQKQTETPGASRPGASSRAA